MARRIEPSDMHTGRLTFGQHYLCPTCKGSGIQSPMSTEERRARDRAAGRRGRAMQQGMEPEPMPDRWPCNHCNGAHVIARNPL